MSPWPPPNVTARGRPNCRPFEASVHVRESKRVEAFRLNTRLTKSAPTQESPRSTVAQPLLGGVTTAAPRGVEPTAWQRWLHHPESSRTHRFLFQFHLWMGMVAGFYIFAISISGSAIVFRNQLEA